MDVAKRIKEMYSYVCPDIVKEFKKYDTESEKYFKTFEGIHSVSKKVKKKKILYLKIRKKFMVTLQYSDFMAKMKNKPYELI